MRFASSFSTARSLWLAVATAVAASVAGWVPSAVAATNPKPAPTAQPGDAPTFLLQNRPERLDPFRESPLQINPPTFRWPATGDATTHRLEFSRDAAFSNPRREITRDPFFRPLEPLDPGVWYWRSRQESQTPGAWLGPESFEISADLPR